MKTEEELIWEAYNPGSEAKEEEDYGCLMVYLDGSTAEEIKRYCQETFNPEILADFGIEDEPHITCQYGFHGDVTPEEITDFVSKIKKPIEIELGEISRFDNDEYDVIKVDVNSKDLRDLSDKIREHFKDRLEITFPNYHPHMTLAYVQKGTLPHIDGDSMFSGKNHTFDEFVYSDANEEKYDIQKNLDKLKKNKTNW